MSDPYGSTSGSNPYGQNPYGQQPPAPNPYSGGDHGGHGGGSQCFDTLVCHVEPSDKLSDPIL